MADALDELRAGIDEARAALAEERLGGRVYDVAIEVLTPGDPIAGTAGSWATSVTLTPRPATQIKGVFRTLEGGLQRIGDATVSAISRANYTEAQLRGNPGSAPTRWVINGKRYTLVDLQDRPTEWIAILKGQVS